MARPHDPATAGPSDALPDVHADARPATWPAGADVPDGVREARRSIERAREALRRERRAFDAEIRIAPTAELLARDDPPRPAELELDLHPEATLAWSPLRSEMLLAEARVLEAETAWIDAWREASLAVRTRAVELDRARADLAAATRVLARLDASAADEARRHAAREEPPATDEAPHDDGAFDLREARLDRDDVVAEVRDLERSFSALGLEPPTAASPRPEPIVPAMPDPVDTRAYRALALRSAADVARSERRWRDAVVPLLALEVGYAGSDARIEGGLELRHGRPSARLDAALVGTPQERGWARLSAAFRIGTDLGPLHADRTEARFDEVQRLAAFEEAWFGRWNEAMEAFDARLDRWRLAEDRLAAMSEADDRERQRDRARRAWLRMMAAYATLLELAEAWPAWRSKGPTERARPDAPI